MNSRERVLEIGAGYGSVARHLEADRVSHIVMLDSSPKALQRSRPPKEEALTYAKILGDEESLHNIQSARDHTRSHQP